MNADTPVKVWILARADAKDTGKKVEAAKKGEAKAIITPELRRDWLRVRAAWNSSPEAFTGVLSMIGDKSANKLYDVIKLALFKGSHVEILRAHPEMKELVKTDDDRLCMHDTYEALSRRLGRKEPYPSYVAMRQRVMGFGKRVEDI